MRFTSSKYITHVCRRGFAPDPTGELTSLPDRPPAGFRGTLRGRGGEGRKGERTRGGLDHLGHPLATPWKWKALELCSFGMGGVADRRIHAPPHMCCRVKLGSSEIKGVRIKRTEHPKLGSAAPWGGGVTDT